MSFLDSIKEFFGGGIEDIQNTVSEQVNVEELQQNVEGAVQDVGDQAGQKVEEIKDDLTGGQE